MAESSANVDAKGAGPSSAALHGAFAAVAAIWSSTFLVISIGNDSLPPMWAATIRLLLASLILTTVTLARGHSLPRGPALRAAALYGFFNLGLGFALLYWAEQRVASGLASVFYATIPLSNTFLTRAFGLERITWRKVAAASVAFIGVVVIFSGQAHGAVELWPMVVLLFTATASGFGAVMLKLGPRQSPIGANAVGASVGLVVCLVGSVLTREQHPIPSSVAQIFPIVYLALAGSVGAFVLMSWLINHWEITRISFVSVIIPILAMSLGVVFRHERLTVLALIGSGLVIAGVLLRIYSDRVAARTAHDPH